MAISMPHAVPMVIADLLYDPARHFGYLLLRKAGGSRVLPIF